MKHSVSDESSAICVPIPRKFSGAPLVEFAAGEYRNEHSGSLAMKHLGSVEKTFKIKYKPF
jgi:hypothetical protein